MQALNCVAAERSGVPTALAQRDLNNLYERLGEDTIRAISARFYDSVYSDDQEWFRGLFANTTKAAAIRNQSDFLIERLGGPPLYTQRKGPPSLIGRHGPYSVDARGAARWLHHMEGALAAAEQRENGGSDATEVLGGGPAQPDVASEEPASSPVSGAGNCTCPFLAAMQRETDAAGMLDSSNQNGDACKRGRAAVDDKPGAGAVRPLDADSRRRLSNFFAHFAHFIVAGRELVNKSRLIGYSNGREA